MDDPALPSRERLAVGFTIRRLPLMSNHRLMRGLARLSVPLLAVALPFVGGGALSKDLQPSPPPLDGVTSVHVTITSCANGAKTQLKFEEPVLTASLASEMERLRRPAGIEATKFSCGAAVDFVKDGRRVALVHVLPCSAVELAPVSGRRYFQYPGGLRQLPELRRLVGDPGKGAECR